MPNIVPFSQKRFSYARVGCNYIRLPAVRELAIGPEILNQARKTRRVTLGLPMMMMMMMIWTQ